MPGSLLSWAAASNAARVGTLTVPYGWLARKLILSEMYWKSSLATRDAAATVLAVSLLERDRSLM